MQCWSVFGLLLRALGKCSPPPRKGRNAYLLHVAETQIKTIIFWFFFLEEDMLFISMT